MKFEVRGNVERLVFNQAEKAAVAKALDCAEFIGKYRGEDIAADTIATLTTFRKTYMEVPTDGDST